MPACNIDARGRSARLLGGMVTALIGSILFTLLFMRVLEHTAFWCLAGVLMVSGAFMIYEGWAGWCALRAMGIRTKL